MIGWICEEEYWIGLVISGWYVGDITYDMWVISPGWYVGDITWMICGWYHLDDMWLISPGWYVGAIIYKIPSRYHAHLIQISPIQSSIFLHKFTQSYMLYCINLPLNLLQDCLSWTSFYQKIKKLLKLILITKFSLKKIHFCKVEVSWKYWHRNGIQKVEFKSSLCTRISTSWWLDKNWD